MIILVQLGDCETEREIHACFTTKQSRTSALLTHTHTCSHCHDCTHARCRDCRDCTRAHKERIVTQQYVLSCMHAHPHGSARAHGRAAHTSSHTDEGTRPRARALKRLHTLATIHSRAHTHTHTHIVSSSHSNVLSACRCAAP